jgi:hypothetical protein
MRKLVLLFATTTIGFAIACGHLYRELERERDRTEAAISDPLTASPALDALDESSATAEDESPSMDDVELPSPARDPSLNASGQSEQVGRAERMAQRRAQLTQRWSDPEFRARQLTRLIAQVRGRNPDVGSALRLNPSQERTFVDLLAKQQLQLDELNQSRRFATAAERQLIRQQIEALSLQHEQERAEQLGPARYEEYRQYQRQIPEREQLRALRARLDESSSLTSDQASRLLTSMHEERDSYLQQLKTVEGFGGYAPRYPFEAMTNNRDQAARIRFAQEQVARTEAFMSQLRLRASGVLNAEQLRRFDEIQEEQLNMVQARVERIRNQGNRPRGRR